MAMTAAVKDELSRVPVTRMSARKAELATMLRFAGALHLIGGHIVIEAEIDTGSVARRLRKEIADIFGHGSEVQIVAGGGLRKSSRYLVRVTKDGERLARQAGLVDLRPSQRPEAADAVQSLRAGGIRELIILSGDHDRPTRQLAGQLGRHAAGLVPNPLGVPNQGHVIIVGAGLTGGLQLRGGSLEQPADLG